MDNLIDIFKGSNQPKLLWTNPNQTSSYGGVISLDLFKYTGVLIQLRHTPSYNKIYYIYMPIGTSYYAGGMDSDAVAVRYISVTSTQVNFTSNVGFKYANDGSFHLGTGYGTYSSVPQKIWGVNFKLN